jgi:lipid-A-disaccharide synthase
VNTTLSQELFCEKYGLEPGNPIITILPGSRRGEIAHHVPVLVEAIKEIRQKLPYTLQIVVAVAPGLDIPTLEARFPSPRRVWFLKDDIYNALAAADLAIVSSGTATVETALLGTPMIVFYRLSPLTARLAKPLVRTKFFSMVNLIAGRAVVPELIQDDFTPQRVAGEAEKLLSTSKESRARVEVMTQGLEEVRRLLGPPGAVERAADEIVRLLAAAESNAK